MQNETFEMIKYLFKVVETQALYNSGNFTFWN